jgi:hypothetical protein
MKTSTTTANRQAEILAWRKGSFTARSETQNCPCGRHHGTGVGPSIWRVRRNQDGGTMYCERIK